MSLFSDFIRLATPEQKRAVYMEVLRQVEQMQRETVRMAGA